MARSEASKKAQAKYRGDRDKVRVFSMSFSAPEFDLWDFLHSQPNMRSYIKNLIREDMNKKKEP